MAESQTVVILSAKRAELAAAIENYERELDRARADYAHITAALVIFDAGDKPGSQRPYTHLVRGFQYGEIARWCRDKLADGPLATPDPACHGNKRYGHHKPGLSPVIGPLLSRRLIQRRLRRVVANNRH
jgi:hypothetical protein